MAEAGATMDVNIVAGGIRCHRFHSLIVGSAELSLRTTTDGAVLGGTHRGVVVQSPRQPARRLQLARQPSAKHQ